MELQKVPDMKLSEDILKGIQFAETMGFTKLHLVPPAQTRESMKHLPAAADPTPVARTLDRAVPGPRGEIPVRIYVPKAVEGTPPTITFFHGGGFVLMSIDSHDEICRQLCAQAGAVVMSVDYRLAPEHPFPAGPEDCIAATRWLMSNAAEFGADGMRMAVAGDSAGGYMALSVAQALANDGVSLRAQVVAYPVTDHYSHAADHASWEENKEGYVLSAEVMRWFWDHYITDERRFDEASPLRQDVAKVCPALIITANFDPLRDEGKAYAEKLQEAGVQAEYINYANVHGFFGNKTEMGDASMQLACDFLRSKLSSG